MKLDRIRQAINERRAFVFRAGGEQYQVSNMDQLQIAEDGTAIYRRVWGDPGHRIEGEHWFDPASITDIRFIEHPLPPGFEIGPREK